MLSERVLEQTSGSGSARRQTAIQTVKENLQKMWQKGMQ